MKHPPCILLALGWYSAAIHHGIAKYARQAGWVLDLGMTRGAFVPRAWKGDGIICLLHKEPELYDFIKSAGKPVVNIGDVNLRGVPTVHTDSREVGMIAADHFLERGFRHMAFFLRIDTPAARERCDAFRSRVEQSGATFHFIDWATWSHKKPDSSETEVVRWLGNQIKTLPKPLAVFSQIDECAIDVLYACRERGIRVPEEVAVLGVDDDKLRCEFAPVPLSSIDSNQDMEGYEAASLLGRLLRGEPKPKKPLLVRPIGVTTRLSTDILAIQHPHVAAALRYVWSNFDKQINAKTVASMVPISARRLHDAFLEHVGKTLADVITQKRVEKAKRLLIETDRKGLDIAFECGFPNDDRMGRVFMRELGITPMEFREKNRRDIYKR
jgi:LacI family transcriptional regulator